jgi:methylglutaconyl-CoA hydratase
MPAHDPVLCAVDARCVAVVTLNRPEIGNAYDSALIDGLIAVFGRLAREPGLRCVVLRGAGRHFQAGADLASLRHLTTAPDGENFDFSRRTVAAITALRHFPKPTVAVIQGGCFGGGVGIAAACDIAIAAEDAVFAISEVRWGITAAPIIPLLVASLGSRMAGRLALTGERFGAAEALRIGLVHEVCAPGELGAATTRIVDHLLRAAPGAAAMTKALVAEAAAAPDTPAFRERIVGEAASRRQLPEAAEGLASFAEKRMPAWYPGASGEVG